ncbi:hypothetical protein OOT46_16230 [Aquabacterium sp. A7-Y]|uniref:hypothetical protein n=1 Tax=Aquabacterium sp. A7-Y TaxID=1349605 RepID=UPI00223D28D0|nr:hypothetical protein [Aquabacterium sp. A7-Y]MCW7539393.1 hypothetical protein [Aquabacterium sp. A7-Y]
MKLRSLLYDAGCSVCTDIARDAEAEARGWLRIRPLQDPEMRQLLADHAPKLGRRPALVTQDGDRVTVSTGWTMLAKLAGGVGPRRCWRLLCRLAEAKSPAVQRESSARRQLLRAFGGGTLAAVTGFVMASPSSESEDDATLITDERRSAVIAAVRGEIKVQIAEQQLLGLGFLLTTDSAAVLRSRDGDQLTMVFYPDANGRPDRAGVMAHERTRDGTTRVRVEALEAAPEALSNSAGRYRRGELRTTSSMRIAENGGIVVPAGRKEWFVCMLACLGAQCPDNVGTCLRLWVPLPVILACMVGLCGRDAYRCHQDVCKDEW